MFTPHMAATSMMSATRLCMALICGGLRIANYKIRMNHVTQLQVAACLDPCLVQDGGIGWQHDAVLDESHTDPSGGPQLLLRSIEPVTLQLKVALTGSFHSRGRELQRPAHIPGKKRKDSSKDCNNIPA